LSLKWVDPESEYKNTVIRLLVNQDHRFFSQFTTVTVVS
jgi:hypothetical protein